MLPSQAEKQCDQDIEYDPCCNRERDKPVSKYFGHTCRVRNKSKGLETISQVEQSCIRWSHYFCYDQEPEDRQEYV